MSLFQFNVVSALAGSSSPYSTSFEELATKTLEAVTSANVSLVYPRQDAYAWDGAGDQVAVDRPRATLDASWVFASGINEKNIGFIVSPSGSVPALAGLNQERNYYLLINQNNRDSIGYIDPQSRVMAFGNSVLTRYDFNATVGQPSTINASFEALNLLIQPSGSGQVLPAVYKQSGIGVTGKYALPVPSRSITNFFDSMPSAIQLTFQTGSAMGVLLSGDNACPVESFGFSIDLPRIDVKDMGWAYPNERPIQWPVNIGIRASVWLNTFQLDALNRMNCPDTGYAFTVGFKNNCSTTEDFAFQFNGAKMDSENLSISVGGGVTKASMSWSLKINDINRRYPNFFINSSGTPYTSVIFPQVGQTSGVPPLTFNLSTSCFLNVLNGPGILSGNSVFVTDDPGAIVTVRCSAADGSDTQDIIASIS